MRRVTHRVSRLPKCGWISFLFPLISAILVWYHSNCFEAFPKTASRCDLEAVGAGDGIRTRDPLLGKQLRYHCATPARSD